MVIVWRQKHSQFPGPGRGEHNVVGTRLWPTYAAKSIGLFFLVVATIATLGGFAQITPVWLYGPYEPTTVTSPAQPDWYFGWLEGALRLFPPVEPVIFGYRIPNLFVPGVLVPGITFLLLYSWPFLEAKVSGDREGHNLLQRPRDNPVRTAIGAGALSFYATLLAAGGNDLIARILRTHILTVTTTLQILVFVLPPVVAALTFVLCRALRSSGARGPLHLSTRDLRLAVQRRRST
jgi:ubiquinol-cytochrome c reductase cytochrome b subunit